jgi:quercetin dioxygenase-like cupin family protein
MIIAHESIAPKQKISKPFERTLKVLLSPVINKEIKSLACGLTIIPKGGRSDEDAHIEGELFYVIYGRGIINVDGEEESLIPGTAVWCPPNISHFLLNNGIKTLKILWVLNPPGREINIINKSK